jgi:hypothetical protein
MIVAGVANEIASLRGLAIGDDDNGLKKFGREKKGIECAKISRAEQPRAERIIDSGEISVNKFTGILPMQVQHISH